MSKDKSAFTVWYRAGPRRRWQKANFDDLEAAASWIDTSLSESDEIFVYENDVRFIAKGKERRGSVTFLWNRTAEEDMEQEPQGRGFGWTDDFDCFVVYECGDDVGEPTVDEPVSTAGAETLPDGPWGPRGRFPAVPTIEHAEGAARYVQDQQGDDAEYEVVACYTCGKHVPQNHALSERIEILTGRTSGTRTAGFSQGSRHGSSSRGFSHSTSSHRSVRATSGRNHFKVENVFFCSVVCKDKQYADTIGDKPLWEKALFVYKLLR